MIKELLKKHTLFFEIIGALVYLELIFKGLIEYRINLGFTAFVLGLGLCVYLLIRLFNEKTERIILLVILGLISFLFSVQLCMYNMYNFFFDFGLLAAAEQIGAFWKDIITLVIDNFAKLVLIWLPFILVTAFRKELGFKPFENKYWSFVAVAIIIIFISITPANITTDQSIVEKGVIGTFLNDFKEKEEAELIVEEEPVVEQVAETKKVACHAYNIDFTAAESTNSEIQKLNDYFSSASVQMGNEYTGMFEGKNLILIMGESFNDIAVKEDLTPTLYKLINEGFEFTNYYTTSYNSTVGGEFQLLTGMYAMSGSIDTWKAGTNYFPMGIATMFKNEGYTVQAYHDHEYTYMDRNRYEAAVGFDKYIGCGNGLEKKMGCWNWFESDVDMVNVTVDDWINEEQFFTYYVTVSGHGPYGYGADANRICHKYLDFIREKGYSFSEKVMCYESTMIELDRMLEALINKLEEAGKLEDTVIVLAGDHYPYYLDVNEIAELCGETREGVVGVCENSLIIYNASSEKVVCDKTGNTMDVLPTIYNLFNLDYDARLIPGKDLLSNAKGIALFGNGSWASDYGIYYAHLGKFEPYVDVTVNEDYFEKTNNYAKSKMSLTNRIILNDYYRYIWEYKK